MYENMKKVSELRDGDVIAFGFNYHGEEHDEIIVTNITTRHGDGFIVHFLYGHHSLSEFVKPHDVIAIGNHNGRSKIHGWNGMFDLVNPNHRLLRNRVKYRTSM